MAWTVLVGALMLALAAPAAQANQFKRIRDVNVSCNNSLRCDLFITNPSVTLYTVGFRRSAATDAPLALYLTMREPLAARSEVRFVIDGDEVLTIPVEDMAYRAAISEYIYDTQAPLRDLFAAARRGDRLSITYRTRRGQATAQFSLAGVVAGAIFMDEVQGRIGRDDALAQIGAAPLAPPVTAPGETVVGLDTLPAALELYYEGEQAPCATFAGGAPEPLAGFEANLAEGVTLIGMRCGEGGAYNIPFAYWLNTGQAYERLALPTMTGQGPAAQLLAWNASWDPDTGELTGLFKGRGLGDCGTYSRWGLDRQDGGFGFVLRELRVKQDCDGVYDETYESWEQLWPQVTDKS
ncbi:MULTISPECIES: DUF1176 domain-containing protein [unclassified Roseitalea]|uniref:DUF1176 domain-containing protein n=1 Tax=unclassified Roseitalea TaxID=2639107 RepID=UPI00273FAFFD|nr:MULTISPECIES: DUF1176 domain-containing protein [unclassified Roseitalea]